MKELADHVRREMMHAVREVMRRPGVRTAVGVFVMLDTLLHLVVWVYFVWKIVL